MSKQHGEPKGASSFAETSPITCTILAFLQMNPLILRHTSGGLSFPLPTEKKYFRYTEELTLSV